MSQQKETGTLVVVVLKAQHLHQPSFYKQDPYAQVSLSGLKRRTKVDPKGGQHPVWDDELRFPVLTEAGKDRVNRILEISCYKDEQRGEDVLLGNGTVDIEETLKTGEFDDWVQLETSTGARGEVYLEMTFYANSPPPLSRRPSKLNPSDRLTRPGAYFMQGRQLTPASTSLPTASLQSGGSAVAEERKPSQLPASVNQMPSSLIPAYGSQNQASRQPLHKGSAASSVPAKHRDGSLPPPPIDKEDPGGGPRKNLELPSALHPGGRSGPKPLPPQDWNSVMNTSHQPFEMLPDLPHGRTWSDTLGLHGEFPSISQSQVPAQPNTPEVTSMIGPRIGLKPSIIVEEPVEDHPPLALPAALVSPQGHQEHISGVYDPSFYGPPGQAYVQPSSHAYMPALTQAHSPPFSPSQHPISHQSLHLALGQPQQFYEVSPPMTFPPPHHQQYSQHPSGPPAAQPLSPAHTYSRMQGTQPQLQQFPLQQSSYPPQQQQYPYQQSYSQQQQHPQPIPYAQTSQAPQQYQQPKYPGLPPSGQPTIAPQQRPLLYSQLPQLLCFTPPPLLSSTQSPTPQPLTPQLLQQPQSHLTPPPPPPPPPLSLYNQGTKGSPPSVTVMQPSHVPAPPSPSSRGPIPQSTSSYNVPPPLQPPATVSVSSLGVPHVTLATSTGIVIKQEKVEGEENVVELSDVEARTIAQKEVKVARDDTTRNQTIHEQSKEIVEREQLEQLKSTKEQGPREEGKDRERIEQGDRRQHEVGLEKQEDLRRQEEEYFKLQESECKGQEEEQRRWEGEAFQRREEQLGNGEGKWEDEECKGKEGECKKIEEECNTREEENRRQEQECRRQEQERRKQEEEGSKRKEEEEGRRQEEERRRREEECKRREEERRRQEERIQREHEEADRRRKAAEEARRRAEEAETERRWQEELAHIRARAEQEAADAAFARAQMEEEEAERRRHEEADLTLVRQVQEEAEREERVAEERRRQEEADMVVARREQAHEEELERRRQEEGRRKLEDADRELARRLDMELNLGAQSLSNTRNQSRQRRTGGH